MALCSLETYSSMRKVDRKHPGQMKILTIHTPRKRLEREIGATLCVLGMWQGCWPCSEAETWWWEGNTLLLPSALFPWSQLTDSSQPGCMQSLPSTQRLSGWCTTPLFSPSGINQTCWDSRSLMCLCFLIAF